MNMLYEGKAKQIFATEIVGEYRVHYKDDATAFNGDKKGTIRDKGILNNKISAFFFQLLAKEGILTHYIGMEGERDQIVKKLDMVPLEVIVRNRVAGSLAKRLGIEEGMECKVPILEFCYKNDALGDPFMNDSQIVAIGLESQEHLDWIRERALTINKILKKFLATRQIILVDFKLEFGVDDNTLYLGDEISPDTCRFWDSTTNEKLDKDRFRRDLGNVEDAYREILFRLTGERA